QRGLRQRQFPGPVRVHRVGPDPARRHQGGRLIRASRGMTMSAPPSNAPEGYVPGFGNHVATEAVAGALPKGRNSPQKAPFGLYAEQLSGTAFTAPRHLNRRS